MEEKGLGTKILPEAFDWHYAGAWNHIFNKLEFYKNININQKWEKTEELLRRSVCINIPVNISQKKCNDIAKIIKEGCKIYG